MPTPDKLVTFGLVSLVAAVLVKRVVASIIARRAIPALLKDGAVVIDVRSPAEFSTGHADGSRNIPLDDLARGTIGLDPERSIIVCCASGVRSAAARRWLLKQGFHHVFNGGSWRNLR